jgi:hypothetical protein
MKNVQFGWSQIGKVVPSFIGQILAIGGTIMTALAAIQTLYPLVITDHIIAETGKVIALVGILAPFFGVKKDAPVADDKQG